MEAKERIREENKIISIIGAKVVNVEQKTSQKTQKVFAKLHVSYENSPKDQVFFVHDDELLERMKELVVGGKYDFEVREQGIFYKVVSWENWNCPHCRQKDIKKSLVATQKRLSMLKLLFEKKIELWKLHSTKTVSLEQISLDFADLIEDLDKDIAKQEELIRLSTEGQKPKPHHLEVMKEILQNHNNK